MQQIIVMYAYTPFTRYNRLSKRFDNRLYRVNGALQFCAPLAPHTGEATAFNFVNVYTIVVSTRASLRLPFRYFGGSNGATPLLGSSVVHF